MEERNACVVKMHYTTETQKRHRNTEKVVGGSSVSLWGFCVSVVFMDSVL